MLIGILFGGAYYSIFHELNNRRDLYREVFEKYAEVKGGHVKVHNIYFRQEGDKITGKVIWWWQTWRTTLSSPGALLEPGLEVTALTGGQGENLPYTRESQAILLERALQPGEEILLHVVYEGKIDEAICFPDFTDEEFHDTRLMSFFRTYHSMFRHGGVLLVSGMITRCFSRNVCGIRLPFPGKRERPVGSSV